jgi:hypothetical protein
MVSTDAGLTWTDRTAGLPNRSLRGITVASADSTTAFAVFSGFGISHVYRTTDTGATWTNASAGLPDIPVNALAIDPLGSGSPMTLYIGTDIGIFRSPDGGGQWFTFNQGLPPVAVMGFATHPSGVIQAATYGRGAYALARTSPILPSISSVTVESKKRLTINGAKFGVFPKVFINSVDRTDAVTSNTDSAISLFGKPKKLGLVSGDNTIQISTPGGQSNVFVLTR